MSSSPALADSRLRPRRPALPALFRLLPRRPRLLPALRLRPSKLYFYQAGNLGTYPLIEELVFLFSYSRQAVTATQTGWTAAVLLVTSLVHWRARRADPIDLASLWMCTYFLAFKFIWEHHLVMLLPILAVEYLRTHRRLITEHCGSCSRCPRRSSCSTSISDRATPRCSPTGPVPRALSTTPARSCRSSRSTGRWQRVCSRGVRARRLSPRLWPRSAWWAGCFLAAPATSKDECARALRSLRAGDIPSARLHLDASVAAVRTWPDSVFLYSELLDRLGDREGARMCGRGTRPLSSSGDGPGWRAPWVNAYDQPRLRF